MQYFKSGYEFGVKIGAHSSAVAGWKRDPIGWLPIPKQLRINEVLDLELPIDLTKELLRERLAQEDK